MPCAASDAIARLTSNRQKVTMATKPRVNLKFTRNVLENNVWDKCSSFETR